MKETKFYKDSVQNSYIPSNKNIDKSNFFFFFLKYKNKE